MDSKNRGSTKAVMYFGAYRGTDSSNNWSGWKMVIDDSFLPYDKIIRTQTEFNAFVSDCNGDTLTAKSVIIVGGGGSGASGEYTLSTANNGGIKLPSTLYTLQGINGAKITITNFKYDASTCARCVVCNKTINIRL